MRHTFRLADPDSPEISVDHSHLTGLRVFVGGQRLPRLRDRGRPAWQIPMLDDTTRRVSFAGQLTGLRAVVDGGQTVELERRLAVWELILAALPFGLIGLTGPVGGVLGLIAFVTNLRILRMPWPMPIRVSAALATFAAAFVGSSVVARVVFA